ncbi:hypothetical protein SAMN05444358_11014 [Ruegeria halocynthiae]|uniref:4-amino-4-deoxy-L-arabinose transferase n=1 Tax=Ruegeria halocynthiae TaxID=985054 RepID=A0A1H3E1K2_9RHOB|nr:DUF6077 domain-containing protein [Ruegeria halocynthiae]SDX72517.1 hypothetical protein SAMN05444358_11014 [Ruegeria halocynthiae]
MTKADARLIALKFILVWLGFFSGWSLGSIPLTLYGMPFSTLWIAALTGVLGAIAALRSEVVWAPVLMGVIHESDEFHWPKKSVIGSVAMGAVLVLVTIVYFLPTNDARPFWLIVLVLSVFSIWVSQTHEMQKIQSEKHLQTLSLVPFCMLVLLIWLLYIVVLRADADDAFYLNLPIGMIFSQNGMLVSDTMYGIDNWPVLGTNYKLESLPTLTAAISWLTGISVVLVAHFVLPMIWCVVWAATLLVIGQGLFGRNWWLFALFSVLASMVFAGTLQSWGVHGISRLFHGKAPLILVVVPLIVFVVYRADIHNVKLRHVVPALSALTLAGLGLTANGVYIAPLALGLAVGAGWVSRGGQGSQRLLTMLAAVPVLIAGVWLLVFDKPVGVQVTSNPPPHKGLAIWDMVADKPNLLLLAVLFWGVATAACFLRSGRWLSAYMFVTLLLVINPFVWPLYDRFATGGLNFRLWWAVPVPMGLSLLLTWGVIRSGWLRLGAGIVGAVLMVTTVLPWGLLGTRGTFIKPSMVKLPLEEHEVALQLRELVQPDRTVLASESLSAVLPGFEESPRLVYSRRSYLDQVEPIVDSGRLYSKRILSNWVNGEGESRSADVLEALESDCIGLIALRSDQLTDDINTVLAGISAEAIAKIENYEVYNVDASCE